MSQQTLHDFVLNLLTDPQAMNAFKLDPEGLLSQAGLADISPQDVQDAIPLVIDYADSAADSALTSSFSASLGGAAGSGALATPLGDFAVGAAAVLSPDSGPVALFGLASPFGTVMASASQAGLNTSATGDFSALSDLSDTLDSDALSGDPTSMLVDGSNTGADLASGGLTGGTNSAASLLTAGASATAGLVGTGADLASGVLTDPAGTAETALDGVTAANPGTLPVDVVQQMPASMPVIGDVQPDHVVHGVVGQVPAGDLTGTGGLPVDLPLDIDDPMNTVDGVHENVLDVVNDNPGSDVVQQTGVTDVVDNSPLTDVIGQSPVSDVISLSQPGGATDLVRDVTSLDDLPF